MLAKFHTLNHHVLEYAVTNLTNFVLYGNTTEYFYSRVVEKCYQSHKRAPSRETATSLLILTTPSFRRPRPTLPTTATAFHDNRRSPFPLADVSSQLPRNVWCERTEWWQGAATLSDCVVAARFLLYSKFHYGGGGGVYSGKGMLRNVVGA